MSRQAYVQVFTCHPYHFMVALSAFQNFHVFILGSYVIAP